MNISKEVERTRAEAYNEMLQEALSRPGVREVMEVYQNWRKADQALSAYRQVIKRQGQVTTSNRTNAL